MPLFEQARSKRRHALPLQTTLICIAALCLVVSLASRTFQLRPHISNSVSSSCPNAKMQHLDTHALLCSAPAPKLLFYFPPVLSHVVARQEPRLAWRCLEESL